ncbi:MAG: SGNH/GDSL hydrolase family protein [Burkholderiales bacterium]|nr:SGNH/GDSL hydrolase family protein [Burkholderiales bacterium]
MLYRVATVGLAPLLIAQGRHVRRVTLQLPEPPGARSGTEGQGPRLRLFIVGDSSAAGVGASTQEEAISGQCVSQLSSSFQVSWKLSAQTGYELSDVVEALEAASAETFDAALIAVGVNDVTGRTSLKSWKAQHGRLIHLLTAKFAVRHVLLSSLPPMHRFPALPQPLRWYLGARAKQLNGIVQRIAGADSRCELLEMNFPFEASYMAADGFHPGPLAYAMWGRHAAGAIRRRMQN